MRTGFYLLPSVLNLFPTVSKAPGGEGVLWHVHLSSLGLHFVHGVLLFYEKKNNSAQGPGLQRLTPEFHSHCTQSLSFGSLVRQFSHEEDHD